ncbi:MAG: hypothetical protein ACFFAU_19180 [Candidatus Hodarchaeota archaeon]
MSEETPPRGDTVLDTKRADMLEWATTPPTEQGKLTSARLTPIQPYALSVLRTNLNYWEQLSHVRFLIPKPDTEEFNPAVHIPEGQQFDPRIHWIIDETMDCEFGKQLIDYLLAGSCGVGANRAKIVMETTRDIGRPQTGIFGALGELFRQKDQELEQPEEVPKFE